MTKWTDTFQGTRLSNNQATGFGGEEMTREEAAMKAIAQACRKMLDDFVASNEGQQWMGDVFAGLGVTRISEDEGIHRVAPQDFRLPDKSSERTWWARRNP